MINIYLAGHDFEYEARNTVRIFDMNTDIRISREMPKEYGQGLNLLSELWDKGDDMMSRACLLDGNRLIFETEVKGCDLLLEKEDDKKRRKAVVVKAMYTVLCRYYGVESEYGILTGVRPVKILFTAIRNSKSSNEIHSILRDTYGVSEKKIRLLQTVAATEIKYIDETANLSKYNLYVSIPFCPSKCSYCSFTSFVNKDAGVVDKYLDMLIYDIRKTIEMAGERGLNLHTLYIGGGTPSVMSVNQMERLFEVIGEYYSLSNIEEITFEAGRPDTITQDKLDLLRKYHVNRISINPQTMNQGTLTSIGRKHSVDDIRIKYEMARSAGFDSINMDLILGLPGESEDDVLNTVREITFLRPENITVHSLSYKKGSALINESRHSLTKDYELLENMHEIADSMCMEAGYVPYYMYRQKNIKGNLENVGYTLPGRESIYNIVIIEEIETILACGAGASSKIMMGNSRHESCHNFKSLEDYMLRTNEQLNEKQRLLRASGQ